MKSLPEPNVKTTLSPTLSVDVISKYFALPEVEISLKLQANPDFPVTDIDAELSFSLRLNQTLGALNETAKDLRTSYPVTP
ncbi:hypothetical protein EZ428_04550 [Pedobacter frigiditerrae]|uniref:Uncharacterized protein n=1 Tax=Pedobacter frigiditerrae TaxID=2530452 RepID=A0A4R0N2R1_9SPHI|nr:hypothetical protein [Pedobacter frigiditerrae]TCC94050.1 hypothetical protein EZ428_04550 [Pedobacter frigiditerrae]